MPPKKKICRRDSSDPPVTESSEETAEGKEQTSTHQDNTAPETSTFNNAQKAVKGVTKSTSESESETEKPLDVRGQLEIKPEEADFEEQDDDPEQQESINSEDDDEEGEYYEDDEYDIYGDDEDEPQSENSDNIPEDDYLIDGLPVTRRELREYEESAEFQAECNANFAEVQQDIFNQMIAENGGNIPWNGFDAPSPSPPRTTQPTIRPASHFKCTICGIQAVRRVAGQNAMPHNRGRAFYKCPNTAHGAYFKWEDGSGPFSDESQARFNDWMDSDFDYGY